MKAQRRSQRQIARVKAVVSIVRSLLLATALLVAYAVAPLSDRTTGVRLVVFVVGLVVVGALVSYGVRSVVQSPTPRMRAIEVLLTIVPLFLVSFASAYVGMAQQNSAAFSVSMSRVGALYFTVTVFATVGFGDIVPVTDAARIVVMVQMVGDLVLVGVGVRVLLGAVQLGLERKNGARLSPSEQPAMLEDAAPLTDRVSEKEQLEER